MKKAGSFHLFWLFVLAVLILGCGVMASPPTPTPIPSPTQPPPTATPVPPTSTPLPTDTPTPTVTPAPTQSIASLANELMPVTLGEGVEEAAAYDPGKAGIHKVIIITVVDQSDWNRSLPESWQPLRVSETELVAVFKFNEVLLEWQTFLVRGIGKVYLGRWRIDTEVWLREASTGKQLGYILFKGEEPPPFPGRITSNTVLTGPTVPSEIIQLWMKDYVEK